MWARHAFFQSGVGFSLENGSLVACIHGSLHSGTGRNFGFQGVLRIGTAMAAASSSFQARDFQWVAQLPILWENNRAFRERSLNGQTLLRGISEPGHGDREVVIGNIVCCKMNNEVLKIVLKLMGDNGCIFVAKVYLLQAAALEFHSNSGYPEAASLGVVAHSDGWGLKRMLSFLKRKWMRNQTPRVSRSLCPEC